MKAKNESEFLALKLRYETITIEEIEEVWQEEECGTIERITGFGAKDTCSLCKPCTCNLSSVLFTEVNCDKCVYMKKDGCFRGESNLSYEAIEDAITPIDLLTACRNRAIHMGEVWDKYFKQV